MRTFVEEQLRGRRRERGALPSIRELASEFGASPRTVHLALRTLERQGLVHAIPRKGFFWGTSVPIEPNRQETVEERFANRFLADLRQGAYHPWKSLPPRKTLAQIYGIGVRSVQRVVQRLAERGILEAKGRDIHLSAPPVKPPSTSVLVVVRCNPDGELLLETEREVDFLKSVRRELLEQELGMIRIGYSEQSGGRFLDHSGREVDLVKLRTPLLGAIVSTWLVTEPQRLLERLEPSNLPLSVWWEHAADTFPRRRFPHGISGFNLSFGESAGTAMGRFLTSRGRLDVAFVSPYHGNDWSSARLEGLREHVQGCGGAVREFVAPEVHSPWHLQRRARGLAGMSRELDRILEGFLDDPQLLACPTWVMVNDLAATAMLRLLRARGLPEPHLVGFDNSSDSERLGYDSFEFHTEGMVRQMLHHLANPKAELFSGTSIHEMIGRVVVRSAG